MWDLNADAIMIDWEAEENAKHQTAERCIRGWMDDSGTSTSSTIVNAAGAGDEDSNSTNGTHTAVNTFTFDIMKSRSSDQKDMFGASSSAGASPEVGNTSVMIYSSVSLKPDWLNLSFSESAEQSEVRISQQKQPAKKSRRGPRSRSSEYRGVTFYRRTGRWESHIWDCGKQVYLGGFDTAHSAARAYDRAAIKFRGADADINFNVADYQEDMPQMRNLGKEEFVHILRRQSNGFGRGSSGHRGATLHKSGGWEARMGQLLGKKAYDVVALRCNGTDAGTNFEPSTYEGGLAFLANNDVSCRGLDLSLSIDSSSHAGKLNKVDPRFGYSTSAAIGQLSTSSNHPPMSRALTLHSGTYSPTAYEVQSMETPVTLSSPRMPNWGWQHPQGRGKTISGLPPFSGAASSGFPSSQPGRIVTFPKTAPLPPKLSLSK